MILNRNELGGVRQTVDNHWLEYLRVRQGVVFGVRSRLLHRMGIPNLQCRLLVPDEESANCIKPMLRRRS